MYIVHNSDKIVLIDKENQIFKAKKQQNGKTIEKKTKPKILFTKLKTRKKN